MKKIQKPTGTNDIIANQIYQFNYIKQLWEKKLSSENYKEIITPMFESKELFVRGVGECSDIVSKEMFEFDEYVLRPEGTAPIMRYYLENNIDSYQKLFYFGPFFRKERPQKGRYRQFYQYGLEIFKEKSPQAEVDTLIILKDFYNDLNVKYKFKINYIPNEDAIKKYEVALKDYYEMNFNILSESSKDKYNKKSFFRILDSKDDFVLNQKAPKLSDYYNQDELKDFENIKLNLDSFSINYEIDPLLVRGLDYYQGFVFEVIDMSNTLGSQNALGGGGRYNKLSQQLSNKSISAFGFAGGLERLLFQIPQKEMKRKISLGFVTTQPIVKELYNLKESLKSLFHVDIGIDTKCGFKKMFKRANDLKIQFVIIIGEDEIKNQNVKVKNLKTGNEFLISKSYENLTIEDFIFMDYK